MALIPNPNSELLREPNLLIPGKKPIGPVKIDWGHPLAPNCVAAYTFNSQVNIVNNGVEWYTFRVYDPETRWTSIR